MEITSSIIQRLEPRVPAALLADPHARQRALLTLGTSYVFAAVALTLVPFVETEAQGLAGFVPRFNVIASAGLILLTGPLLRRSGSLLVAGNWMTGLLYVGFVFALLTGGLLESAFWISPILLPLLGTALAGRASGLVWGVAVGGLYAMVYGLSVAGVELVDLTAPGTRDQLMLLAALASTLMLTVIVVMADATHRAVIQRMQETHDALESAIVERERAQVRAHEAVAANTAKSAFLATMSHELRTPLNAIIGYAELMIEEAEDEGQQRDLQDLKHIRGAGKHLLNLISDVLDITRIEAARLELSPETFEPQELLEEVNAMLQPLSSKRRNELRVES